MSENVVPDNSADDGRGRSKKGKRNKKDKSFVFFFEVFAVAGTGSGLEDLACFFSAVF